MKGLLTELASQETTYPFDTNKLLVRHRRQLFQWRPCDRFLPDVQNGYFIDSADWVASSVKRGAPNQIGDKQPIEIQVFGPDGGGSLFAVGTSDGAVYYLPSSGTIENNVYIENGIVGVRRISDSVTGFLQRLLSNVEGVRSYARGVHFH